MEIKPIAYIHTHFPTKFGIPRQSGLVESQAELVLEPEVASAEAVRGIEEFSYLWLIWGFSENVDKGWHPTVRPPRLGGNTRMGVFATRSPFRPNALGLSSVKLEGVEVVDGTHVTIRVSGADLMDGTPIYDIKPYLPYADCHEGAAGFTDQVHRHVLEVQIPEEIRAAVADASLLEELTQVLAQDPRPSYQKDATRIYGMAFASYEVKFRVEEECLYVVALERRVE